MDLPTDPLPLVAVLQIFARDVPELPFPQGTDLCQVLWCPKTGGISAGTRATSTVAPSGFLWSLTRNRPTS